MADEEGWYGTGDIGELDAEGNLYFKGRKKDVIVTPAGMNVYPDDLEAALRRQPEVKDCVVIALPRDGNAEPCAVVILRDGKADPEAVVRRANESLAEYQRMRHWFVWPEEDFPRTSTQKPRTERDSASCASASWASALAGQDRTSPLAELIARVTGRAAGQFGPDANLEADLNLSSLDRVELLSALEDRYQLDFSETRICRGEDGRRSGEDAARQASAAGEVSLSGMGAALAHDVDPAGRSLSAACVPAVFLLGWPRIRRAGKSARTSRAGAGCLQSHRRCGCWFRADRASGPLPSPAGDRHRRRSAGGIAHSAQRAKFAGQSL